MSINVWLREREREAIYNKKMGGRKKQGLR